MKKVKQVKLVPEVIVDFKPGIASPKQRAAWDKLWPKLLFTKPNTNVRKK